MSMTVNQLQMVEIQAERVLHKIQFGDININNFNATLCRSKVHSILH